MRRTDPYKLTKRQRQRAGRAKESRRAKDAQRVQRLRSVSW